MAIHVLTILLLVACCHADDLTLRGSAMGTGWSVKARASEVSDPDTLRRLIGERLAAIERSMSTWRDDTEISRFNATHSTDWFAVSPDFARVLRRGLEISLATEGAFDPSMLPLVRAWGFTKVMPQVLPGEVEIAELLAQAGYRKLASRLDPPAIRKTAPRVEIDLSAIAKGYAVDALAALLVRRSCKHWLVDIGGEVRGQGLSTKARPWRIGIEAPLVGERRIHTIVELSTGAVATSGDYRNHIEKDGRRYAHIIDPSDGRPIPQRGLAVSVRAPDCLTADAWATALCVLGPQRGLAVAEGAGMAALFLRKEADAIKTWETSRWREMR